MIILSLAKKSPQQRPKMCLYQTSGRRPPPVTGRYVNTVTRGLVGARNERAPLRFHNAVVCFVDWCLSRTRNLAASSKHLAEFFSGRSWSKIGQDFFFGFFEKFETFFSKICAHSEWYRNLLAGIFQILTFYGTSRFHCHRYYFRNALARTSFAHEKRRT